MSLLSFIPASIAVHADTLALAALIAFGSGFVRGFSGFGAGMIYVPLIGALYGPRFAVTSILIVDFICTVPFLIAALPHVRWRELNPMILAATLTIPLGTAALIYVDPTPLRWAIAALIVIFVVLLASGWRYKGQPSLPVTLGVGATSGLLGGATQIPGPPVIIFWLGGVLSAVAVRANLITYFALFDVVSLAAYGFGGLLTNEPVFFGLAMILPFLAGASIGSLVFAFVPDASYRKAAYFIILIAAITSVPLFDRLLR
ncbi:MAG: sulfite exporter TauE/SafE family protein [Xanthobacteraceae bacterium]|nr:sulfite exporter TauE/SafE family protein [Xanthobacteraceae bacterium]QYK44549.1 MAG: sulfite exporter TauE/SafE family protein [Xanthobacteraceae bacterium]HMN52167.1 sulfite exporter TauE/SafE family protein [Xanthobacteraceae bacterium]